MPTTLAKLYPVVTDTTVLLLYVIAAVAGGLGGCAAAAYYATHARAPRVMFLVAYMLLGVVFGVISLATIATWGLIDPGDVHLIILISLLSGSAGALALVSANLTIMLILRRLGIEIQITMRKPDEERRHSETEASL